MSDYSIKATITADDSGYQKAVKNTIKATDDMGSSLASTFSSLRDIMQGPIAAINMAKQALDGMWDATIGQAGKMEDMTAAFTPLVGGAENAAEMIAALNREAATTPFELEGIGNVAKQLLPVLGNDVNAVTDTFRMLGDTAGGNINKLDSITRGYVKTMNSGKVSLEALNMISDAGVPIQNQLADSMGISVQQMYKMITAGDVSSDELTKAFQKMTSEGGLFFNGMDIASQTLNGKLSSMTDAFKMSGAAIGNVFLPIIKDIVTLVSEVVGGFASWANTGDNLKSTMITVAQIIATVAAAIAAYTIVANAATAATTAMSVATKIAAAAQAILNAIITANPLGLIVAGIALVVGAIIIIVDKMGGWKIAFLEVQKVALIVVGAILDYFSWFTNNLISIVNIALGVYNKVAGVIGAKPIKLMDEVDLKTAAGITDKIKDLNDQIRETKEEKARVKLQDDKTAKSMQSNANATKTAEINASNSATTTIVANNEKETLSDQESADKQAAKAEELKQKRIDYELEWSTKARESATSLVADKELLNQQELANLLLRIEAEESAEIAKAEALGVNEQTIADIHATYEAEKTKATQDAAEKQIEAGKTIGDAFTNTFKDLAKKGASWNSTMSSIANTVGSFLSEALTAVGESLVTGESDWSDYGTMALRALSSILQSLGSQLAAVAALHAVMLDAVGAGIAAAASAAAFVASGVISGLANQIEASAEAEKEAAANAVKYTTALAAQNKTLSESKSLFTNASKSAEKYSAVLVAVKKSVTSFYDSLQEVGSDISSSLIDGLTEGLSSSDFLTEMKKYITELVIKTAVYTDELTAKIASIGAKISTAIASGVSASNMSGLVAELKAIYEAASTKASAATAIVSSAFTGYASGTENASRGWHVVGEQGPELKWFNGGERVVNARDTALALASGGSTSSSNMTVNATFNSPKAMNQYEQMRALKQYNRELRFKGVTA